MRLKRYHPPGTPPGTLRPVEPGLAEKATMRVFDYDAQHVDEKIAKSAKECSEYVSSDTVTWIDVDRITDLDAIESLGKAFGLHPLALEDVLNVPQRPKLEEYEDHLFIALRMVSPNGALEPEQVSMFLGRNYVITFQERPGDCFDPVRDRIRKAGGRIREEGADYLAYALIDAVVDGYFPVLEAEGERVEELEEEVVGQPSQDTLRQIRDIRRDLMALRRSAWPQRDAINALVRGDTPLVTDTTRPYLRDCYDHIIQVIDVLETYRELAGGLMEVYLSSLSNKMNEVMKTLTVVAAIFIPLTFIAGVYGMNFNPERSRWNMPELNWAWGYPAVWVVMLAVLVGMLMLFRRKKWL